MSTNRILITVVVALAVCMAGCGKRPVVQESIGIQSPAIKRVVLQTESGVEALGYSDTPYTDQVRVGIQFLSLYKPTPPASVPADIAQIFDKAEAHAGVANAILEKVKYPPPTDYCTNGGPQAYNELSLAWGCYQDAMDATARPLDDEVRISIRTAATLSQMAILAIMGEESEALSRGSQLSEKTPYLQPNGTFISFVSPKRLISSSAGDIARLREMDKIIKGPGISQSVVLPGPSGSLSASSAFVDVEMSQLPGGLTLTNKSRFVLDMESIALTLTQGNLKLSIGPFARKIGPNAQVDLSFASSGLENGDFTLTAHGIPVEIAPNGSIARTDNLVVQAVYRPATPNNLRLLPYWVTYRYDTTAKKWIKAYK